MQQPYEPSADPAPGEPVSEPATGPAGEAGARARVLVVDDDPTVAEVVTGYLDRAGYAVDRAGDGPEALRRAAAHWPDLVVLDLMLPGMDGLEVCRRMRARGPVPVVMLTARGDEDDRILGLEVGADDYVTKPFSPRELVLRVESVLRRTRPAARPLSAGPLSAAGLTVDPTARRATKNGTELALTLREFDLLAFFLRHPGRGPPARLRHRLARHPRPDSSGRRGPRPRHRPRHRRGPPGPRHRPQRHGRLPLRGHPAHGRTPGVRVPTAGSGQ